MTRSDATSLRRSDILPQHRDAMPQNIEMSAQITGN